MARFIAVQRHEVTEVQKAELKTLGFEKTENVEKTMKADDVELGKMLDELGLASGDGLSFVAPALISGMLTNVAKSRGIRVLLPDQKAAPARRAKLPFPGTLTDEQVVFMKTNLSNSLDKGDGIVVLGQMPFDHIKYVEV